MGDSYDPAKRARMLRDRLHTIELRNEDHIAEELRIAFNAGIEAAARVCETKVVDPHVRQECGESIRELTIVHERPSSEFSTMEIAFAQAEGRMRVDANGYGWITPARKKR